MPSSAKVFILSVITEALAACARPLLVKGPTESCNLYWASRQVHVCLVGMPQSECQDLFLNPGFSPERTCVCGEPGYKSVKVLIPGYRYKQISCSR